MSFQIFKVIRESRMLVKDFEHKRQTSVRERIKCHAKKLLTIQLTTLSTAGSYRIYYFSLLKKKAIRCNF